MPTRVSRTTFADWTVFCWKNVYDLAKNFQIFFKIMLLTLFYLERTCDGEQKLFLRINLHVNAHKGIETMFAWLVRLLLNNVYDLANTFQIFFKNMLLTLFYPERHVMESKNYFWEFIFILMPTRISRRLFCWLDRLLLKNVYDLAKNFQIFFKNMLLTLFYLERHVMESKNYFEN